VKRKCTKLGKKYSQIIYMTDLSLEQIKST
jgi:hypothetical protein